MLQTDLYELANYTIKLCLNRVNLHNARNIERQA